MKFDETGVLTRLIRTKSPMTFQSMKFRVRLAAIILAVAGLTLNLAHAQNILVTNAGNGTISEFDSSGGLINSSFISGLSSPVGIAFDSSGNIYVANSGAGAIAKFDSSGGLINSTFISGLSSPNSLTFDGSGNVYVANSGANTILEYNSSGTFIKTFASGVNAWDLTFNGSGHLYVSSYGGNSISEFASDGSTIRTLTASLNNPAGLALDNSGNLYAANDGGGNSISEFAPDGSLITADFTSGALSGSAGITGLAFDGSGKFYLTSYSGNQVLTFDSSGAPQTPLSGGMNAPVYVAITRAVPEPSTLGLVGLGGVVGLLALRRRK